MRHHQTRAARRARRGNTPRAAARRSRACSAKPSWSSSSRRVRCRTPPRTPCGPPTARARDQGTALRARTPSLARRRTRRRPARVARGTSNGPPRARVSRAHRPRGTARCGSGRRPYHPPRSTPRAWPPHPERPSRAGRARVRSDGRLGSGEFFQIRLASGRHFPRPDFGDARAPRLGVKFKSTNETKCDCPPVLTRADAGRAVIARALSHARLERDDGDDDYLERAVRRGRVRR